MTTLNGSFEVTSWDETTYRERDGRRLTRASHSRWTSTLLISHTDLARCDAGSIGPTLRTIRRADVDRSQADSCMRIIAASARGGHYTACNERGGQAAAGRAVTESAPASVIRERVVTPD
jgi:hypothetical protein